MGHTTNKLNLNQTQACSADNSKSTNPLSTLSINFTNAGKGDGDVLKRCDGLVFKETDATDMTNHI